MPIRVSDLGGKLRHLQVKWEGEVVNITYSPSRSSLIDAMELAEVEGDSPRQIKALAERLCQVLVGWDILEDRNGEDKPDTTLAISEEIIMQLPQEFVMAIFQAIRDSQEPNPPRSRRSNAF